MAMAHRAPRSGPDAAAPSCTCKCPGTGERTAAGNLPSAARKLLDDWAVGSIISATGGNKMLQRVAHRMQGAFAFAQVGNSRRCERLDVGAGARPIAPERQEFTDLGDGKPEIAGTRDEAQTMDVVGRVVPILRVTADGARRQADLLIVAHHAWAEPCGSRCFADVHKSPLDLDMMSTPTLRGDA